MAIITALVFAERFINFTDANGKRHQYELAGDDEIVVTRPDGIGEAVIVYEDGELFSSTTHRPGESPEATIAYYDGKLLGACKVEECQQQADTAIFSGEVIIIWQKK